MIQHKKVLRIRWVGMILLMILVLSSEATAQLSSKIIFPENGRLTYLSDKENNRIPDFSHAGYRGGGVPLPNLPIKLTLSPVFGDNSQQIQQAINEIGNLPPDENGFRGAILLNPGLYQINHPINIDKSGVVLRGSGSGNDATEDSILSISSSVTETALQLGSEVMSWVQAIDGTQTNITSHFVPVGSRLFEVQDASIYEVGDHIIIQHPSTQKWINAVDGGGTAGALHWQSGTVDIFYYRSITGIRGNTIAIDAPVFNHLDRSLSQSVIYKPDNTHLIYEVGVEDLRIVIQTAGPNTVSHTKNGIFYRGVKNGWAKNVAVLHFSHSGIGTHTSSQITVSNSKSLEPHSSLNGGLRYNFNADLFSNNILFTGVSSSDGRRSFIANGISTSSGIVFHKAKSVRALASSEGHQKWTQGLLFDNITFEDPQHYNVLSLHNRGSLGSSHGWSTAHSVAWNVDAGEKYIFIQKPPTAQNYGIGNKGQISGIGLFEHPVGYIAGSNMTPNPISLYDTQLEERLRYGTPPDAPIDVSVSTDTPNEITLSWNHLSVDGDQIVLERSDDGEITFSVIAFISEGNTFTDVDISDIEYHYRLKAFNSDIYSAYTKVYSAIPIISLDSFPDFFLRQPKDKTVLPVRDDPNAEIVFSWEEMETIKNLDLTYSWFFDVPGGDFSEPIIKIDSLTTATTELRFSDIGKILRHSGIEVGEQLEGEWKVKATYKTQEKWSANSNLVSFLKESKFLPEELSTQPFNLDMDQNYPNPFYQNTTIRYYLEEPDYVRFEVFDLRGRRLIKIDKGEKPRGAHQIDFAATNFSSGFYFYRIGNSNTIIVRQMILFK